MTELAPLSRLDALPAEIVHEIGVHLALPNIREIRLASKSLVHAFQENFNRYLKNKTLEWNSEKQLQQFVCCTEPDGAGLRLQNLTIVGIVSGPKKDILSRIDVKNDLLTKAFTNLQLNSTRSHYLSLTLLVRCRNRTGGDVPCEKWPEWQQVWTAAAQTFEVVTRSLADSALRLEKFNVFDSVNCCSLTCDRLDPRMPSLSALLQNLKALSLSLSSSVIARATQTNIPEPDERYAQHIAQFIKLCPNLEDLSLHWYRLHYSDAEAHVDERSFFNLIAQAEEARFSLLRCCHLAGIHTTGPALVSFFRKAPRLNRLSLHEIYISDGAFSSVLKYVTKNLTELEYLHLEDLWQERRMCFRVPGPGMIPTTSKVFNGTSTLERKGSDCGRPIPIYATEGAPLGSVAASIRRSKSRLLYGPP